MHNREKDNDLIAHCKNVVLLADKQEEVQTGEGRRDKKRKEGKIQKLWTVLTNYTTHTNNQIKLKQHHQALIRF